MSSRTSGKTASGFGEIVKTLVYAILIALFIRTFFYEPFSIPSASMVPTLLVGDYLFVSKFSYGYSRYSLPLGDVAVFKLPCDFSRLPSPEAEAYKDRCDPSTDFIKRVIGLPGDTVQMKEGVLYVNDHPVTEKRIGNYDAPISYFSDQSCTGSYPEFAESLPGEQGTHIIIKGCGSPMLDDTPQFKVPDGHYFMMGDDRDDSSDSRDPRSGVGYVPAANLVGHAQFIFFSTKGYAHWWEPWKWPFTIRYNRLLTAIR